VTKLNKTPHTQTPSHHDRLRHDCCAYLCVLYHSFLGNWKRTAAFLFSAPLPATRACAVRLAPQRGRVSAEGRSRRSFPVYPRHRLSCWPAATHSDTFTKYLFVERNNSKYLLAKAKPSM